MNDLLHIFRPHSQSSQLDVSLVRLRKGEDTKQMMVNKTIQQLFHLMGCTASHLDYVSAIVECTILYLPIQIGNYLLMASEGWEEEIPQNFAGNWQFQIHMPWYIGHRIDIGLQFDTDGEQAHPSNRLSGQVASCKNVKVLLMSCNKVPLMSSREEKRQKWWRSMF